MLYQADRAPKAVPFTVFHQLTGVVSVRLRVKPAGSADDVEWSVTDLVVGAGAVTFAHPLDALGEDLPTHGLYTARVWFYSDAGTVIGDSDEFNFVVLKTRVPWDLSPTTDNAQIWAFDTLNAPLPGLTPTWHTYRVVLTGVVATSPAITDRGDGLYTTPVIVGNGGIVDLGATAAPRYIHVSGGMADTPDFPAYDVTGVPLAGLTPVWVSYQEASSGNNITPQPAIAEVGGGLYRVPLAAGSTGLIDLGVTASPRYVAVERE